MILQGDRSLGECFYILQHLLLIACVADSLNRRGLCDTSGSTSKDSFNCYPTSKTTRESKILVKTKKLHLHNYCYVGILLNVNQKITHSLQMLSSISSSSVKLLVNHNKRSASEKQTFNLSFFVTSHYYKRSAKIDGHAVTLKC